MKKMFYLVLKKLGLQNIGIILVLIVGICILELSFVRLEKCIMANKHFWVCTRERLIDKRKPMALASMDLSLRNVRRSLITT